MPEVGNYMDNTITIRGCRLGGRLLRRLRPWLDLEGEYDHLCPDGLQNCDLMLKRSVRQAQGSHHSLPDT